MDITIFFALVIYLFSCLAVAGLVGDSRKIGMSYTFIISFFFSPVIGIIIAFMSESKESIYLKRQSLSEQKQTNEILRNNSKSITDEIEKLNELRKSGVINEEEFTKAKHKIIE